MVIPLLCGLLGGIIGLCWAGWSSFMLAFAKVVSCWACRSLHWHLGMGLHCHLSPDHGGVVGPDLLWVVGHI